jgi:sensor histidine kinase YesM
LSDLSQNRHFQFWALQMLGWTGWVTLFAIRDAYWGQPFERILLLVVDAIAGLILTTGLRYIYRAVWERPVYQRILTVLIASYVVAAIWQPIKNFSQFYYYQDFELIKEYGTMGYFGGIIGYSYFLMLGWSGLYFALKFYRLLQLQIERSIRAESMAHEAQLRMLRYQLNPHFLFNTLNAISTLILDKNTESANAMVSKLSNFLRYSLDKDPMQKVDLEHEISTMQLYLEIEQVRFDERLTVEFNVDDAAKKALVPSLILQPLVENSIKYAVATCETGGTISIEAHKLNGYLQLVVADDGPGIQMENGAPPDFSGVGLVNTRERLAQLYGASHDCVFGPVEPHGLKIDIRIPYET